MPEDAMQKWAEEVEDERTGIKSRDGDNVFQILAVQLNQFSSF